MTRAPGSYRRLAGSELKAPPDARLIGPAGPDEAVTVRVCLRTRPDGRPLPGQRQLTVAGLPSSAAASARRCSAAGPEGASSVR